MHSFELFSIVIVIIMIMKEDDIMTENEYIGMHMSRCMCRVKGKLYDLVLSRVNSSD